MAEPVLARNIGGLRVPLVAGAVLLAGFLLLPGLIILSASVSGGNFLTFPPERLSLRWYGELLDDPQWLDAFWTSVGIASGGAALATVTGSLAALGLRRVRRGGRLLRVAFIAPIALPYIVFVLGLYNVFDALRVVGAPWPIMVGQGVLAFPIVFVTVDAMLAGVDRRISDAASSLGAGWPLVMWRVELPLVFPAIIASGLFAFSFCFDEAVIALFLSGPETVTFPVKIYDSAQESVSPLVAAASTAVTVLVLGLAALFAVLLRRTTARRALA
jgi:putative spermidine/putrescine transport system permease protein